MNESSGLLMYRYRDTLEVFLVHPGGPFFARRDAGIWTIPKTRVEAGEDPLVTARREFGQETGLPMPGSGYLELGQVRGKKKIVHAWAFEGDHDPADIVSNTFELEWPPRSGRVRFFPEVDRAGYFSLSEARTKIHEVQVPLLGRLARFLEAPRFLEARVGASAPVFQ